MHIIRFSSNRVAWKAVFISALFGLLFYALSLYWTRVYWPDLAPPICSARRLLQGLEPYAGCATNYGGRPAAQYPLTTVLALVPFAILPGMHAIAAVWGAINALLVFGIIRSGNKFRWLVFISGPYALAFIFHQISPLIAAVMLLPGLLPLALLKPQTGLPVILTNLTPRRALLCALFMAVTFAVYPRWPWAWLATARNYDGAIPLLIFPPLALALLRPRSRETWTLFLFACIPQRSIYDLVPLMLLPKSRPLMIIIVALSWLPIAALLSGIPENPMIGIASIYIPLLIMILGDNLVNLVRHPVTQ